jgi:hypothetical protein
MTLTLEVTEQQLEQYRKQAEARGLSLEQWMVQTADSHVPAIEGHLRGRTPQEWSRQLREWTSAHDASQPPLSEYAMSRESIYGDETE